MIAKERQRTGESAPERASKVETIYDAGRRPIGRQCLLIAESGDDDLMTSSVRMARELGCVKLSV